MHDPGADGSALLPLKTSMGGAGYTGGRGDRVVNDLGELEYTIAAAITATLPKIFVEGAGAAGGGGGAVAPGSPGLGAGAGGGEGAAFITDNTMRGMVIESLYDIAVTAANSTIKAQVNI